MRTNKKTALLLAVPCLLLSSCYAAGVMPTTAMSLGGLAVGESLGRAAGEADTEKTSQREIYIGASRANILDQKVTSVKTSDLWVRIYAVIQPNGQGSWVRDAPWDEVIFSIKNPTEYNTIVEKIQAINEQGVFIDQIGTEEPSQLTQKRLYEIGREIGTPDVPSITGMGMGMMATSALNAMIPGAGLLFGGYKAGLGQGKIKTLMEEQERLQKEHEIITEEFRRRQVIKVALAAGGSVIGSAFFPLGASGLREVVFVLQSNGTEKELRVYLPSPSPAGKHEGAKEESGIGRETKGGVEHEGPGKGEVKEKEEAAKEG